ncbi:MAG: ATP-binding cassette domain-containing protein [Ruminococcaceae bacterium]|nr:ATP-binding cassette domain-containing protein [Oscillospiraceae bacterium]
MFEIDRIPREVIAFLGTKGIAEGELELAAHADRNKSHIAADVYLFATKQSLILMTGVMSLVSTSHRHTSYTVHTEWKEIEYEQIPLSELHDFSVEELLSGGRLVAKRRRGECDIPVLLSSFTNFCKESLFLFSKYANKLCEGEEIEIDPKDDPSGKLCPTCGLRYPDLNRKVCPHCMEKGKLFKRFFVFLWRYKAYLIFSVLSLLVLTSMSIIAPYLSSGFFYDEVIFGTGEFAGELLLVLFLIVSTAILKMIATAFNNWLTSLIAAKVVFDLKKTIFSAIERLSLSFFTGRQTGGLMTQVNEDANTIYSFFCDGVPYLLINVVQVAVVSVLLFTIQPILALFSLLTVPLFIVLMRWVFRRERMLHQRRYSHSRRMNGFLADVFSGMRVVKAFSKEEEEIKRFTGRNDALAESERKLSLFTNYSWPLAHQILYVGTVIAWALGGWMIIVGVGGMTYGKILTFIAYMGMIFSPLEFFIHFLDWTANCSNSMQRLFEIMDAEPDVSECEDPIVPEKLDGGIEFSHVSFSYQKGKKIINDVSFEVPDGHILGIVGHTGAGKSTLANLMMRMYDAEDGEIRIGGYPIKELELATIYRNVAIVSQETYLFIGTILDNIRYARPDATLEEVIEAAKCAGAHDFIMKLPDAYHTRIGFGYKDLSGGERQRLSIARAILKNPKILILDEATAAMDTGTERRIQEALTRLIKGKTTIMIAHRLSTLRDADELVVIEHGRLAERGTHKELLEKEDGVYKKLFTLQEEALKSAGISE